jgi:hypothetical protein
MRLGIYCLAALAASLGVLVGLLPRASVPLEIGVRLTLLLAAAGSLGASVHAATSFTYHAGLQTLGREWGWWYLLRPAIGAALGVIFVFAVTGLRSSLWNGAAGAEKTASVETLAGYLALAGLAGMFSRQALDWLKAVFDGILRASDDNAENDKKERLARRPPGDATTKPTPSVSPPSPPDRPSEGDLTAPYRSPWKMLVAIFAALTVILAAGVITLISLIGPELGAEPYPLWIEPFAALLAALAAALGSMIHVFTSIAEFAGRGRLQHQWLWWYVLRPFIAAALGLLVYFGIRALFLKQLTQAPEMYGVLVVSLLAGAFSKQTIHWLAQLYDAFFRRVEKLESKES